MLLVVFSMNTVIGFACTLGIDLGFNNKHHHDDEEAIETTVHVHADGKNHVHEHQENKESNHVHEGSEKGGCCNDRVIKFQSLDKILSNHANTLKSQPVFIAIVPNFRNTDIYKYTQIPARIQLLRFFHPPPPEIRLLIQSFQI